MVLSLLQASLKCHETYKSISGVGMEESALSASHLKEHNGGFWIKLAPA